MKKTKNKDFLGLKNLVQDYTSVIEVIAPRVLFLQDTTLNMRGYAYWLEQYTNFNGYYPERIDMTEDCFEHYVGLLPCFDGIKDAKERIVTFNGIPVKIAKIDGLKRGEKL